MLLCRNIKRKRIPINQQSREEKGKPERESGEAESFLGSAELASEESFGMEHPNGVHAITESPTVRLTKGKEQEKRGQCPRTRFSHAKSVDLESTNLFL